MRTRYVWHFHHDLLFEDLYRPMAHRRTDIRLNKASEERRLRLALFKLVKSPKIEYMSRAKVLKLHRRECPDCPWNESRQTIFTHRVPTESYLSHWCRPSEGRRVSQQRD